MLMQIDLNDPPILKLSKSLDWIEHHLSMMGLDEKVIDKATLFCPELLKITEDQRDRIDSEFQRNSNGLMINGVWEDFQIKVILPYLLAWMDVITAINGKLTKAGERG